MNNFYRMVNFCLLYTIFTSKKVCQASQAVPILEGYGFYHFYIISYVKAYEFQYPHPFARGEYDNLLIIYSILPPALQYTNIRTPISAFRSPILFNTNYQQQSTMATPAPDSDTESPPNPPPFITPPSRNPISRIAQVTQSLTTATSSLSFSSSSYDVVVVIVVVVVISKTKLKNIDVKKKDHNPKIYSKTLTLTLIDILLVVYITF